MQTIAKERRADKQDRHGNDRTGTWGMPTARRRPTRHAGSRKKLTQAHGTSATARRWHHHTPARHLRARQPHRPASTTFGDGPPAPSGNHLDTHTQPRDQHGSLVATCGAYDSGARRLHDYQSSSSSSKRPPAPPADSSSSSSSSGAAAAAASPPAAGAETKLSGLARNSSNSVARGNL